MKKKYAVIDYLLQTKSYRLPRCKREISIAPQYNQTHLATWERDGRGRGRARRVWPVMVAWDTMPDVNPSLQRHLDESTWGPPYVRVVRVAGYLIRKPRASGHLSFSFYTLYARHRDGSKWSALVPLHACRSSKMSIRIRLYLSILRKML